MSAYDNEERALADALRSQATEAGLQPASFEAVRGRAGAIRRRRAIGAGVGLALAAAALAPAAWMVVGPDSAEPLVADNPSIEPSPTPDPTESAQTQGEQVFTAQVAQGEAPRIAYLQGNTLHRPDGRTLDLPKGQYLDFVTQGELTFAVRSVNGELTLLILDDRGDNVASYAGTSEVVASADGSVAAWIDGAGEVWAYSQSGALSLGAAEPGSWAVSVLGSTRCTSGLDSQCAVAYNQPGQEPPMIVSLEEGTTPIGDFIALGDLSETSWAAGQISYTDDSSCHEVLNDFRERAFKTCEHALFDFSPGAQFVTASPTSYLDGFGIAGLTILDAAGRDVVSWSNLDQPPASQDVLYSHVWEDATHVLAITSSAQGWHVLRLGTDGSIEKVLGPVATDDPYADAPYVLEGR